MNNAFIFSNLSNFNIRTSYPDYNVMWKDFSNLTINLYLDEDMPIIKSSNLEFEKVDTRTYQYVSDMLPVKNTRAKTIGYEHNPLKSLASFSLHLYKNKRQFSIGNCRLFLCSSLLIFCFTLL
ncbi:MAG TPA: hypothetical protein DEP23_08960 [Ruminococcaceae bacterium]|nr:hypothetical protein [Oscillospiraceae bacterium]